jgi:C_GCAxxG_C_C family probable redox protein
MKRRKFILGTGAAASMAALHTCTSRNTGGDNPSKSSENQPDAELPLSKQLSSDQLMTLLDLKAAQYMKSTENCAQSTYLALSDVFGLENNVDIKALTAIPGIAERGEICGCIISSLLAIGLEYGSDNHGDRSAYERTLVPANRICDQFEAMAGSSRCSDILEKKFGKKLNLRTAADLHEYRANDGPAYCTTLVQKAVKITANQLLAKNT